MAGHVFVVRGDLTKLACDAWLLPVDADFNVTTTWAGAVGLDPGPIRGLGPWGPGERVRELRPRDRGTPAVWIGDVGRWGAEAQWFAEAATAFISAAGRTLLDGGRSRPPLLAINHLGIGDGGAAQMKGETLEVLFGSIYEHLANLTDDIDVVVVSWTTTAHAAAQRARMRVLAGNSKHALNDVIDTWPFLDPERAVDLRATARVIADHALSNRLAVFMGAGVSVGAGLPSWNDLLADMGGALSAPVLPEDLARLADPRDRAALLEMRYSHEDRDFHAQLVKALGSSSHSLQHALLNDLPTHEFITTNFDELFELAAQVNDHSIRVLPPTDADDSTSQSPRWLLKLHGTLSDPASIVLTRGAYIDAPLQRGALLGLVQAMLLTKHMVFVGYGLNDEDFHELVHEVRYAQPRDIRDGALGTALTIVADDIHAQLWQRDVRVVPMLSGPLATQQETFAMAGREIEKFLDLTNLIAADRTAFLLDPEYSGMLDEQETELALLLQNLLAAIDLSDERDGWRAVAELLRSLGAMTISNPSKPSSRARVLVDEPITVEDDVPGVSLLEGDPVAVIGSGLAARLFRAPPTWRDVGELRLDTLSMTPHLGPVRMRKLLDRLRASVADPFSIPSVSAIPSGGPTATTDSNPHQPPFASISEACDALLTNMDERDRAILERILHVQGTIPTLEAIGTRFGITRERVRQLEAKLKRKLDSAIGHPRMAILTDRADEIRSQIGALIPLADAPPDLRPDPDSLVDEILSYISGPYVIDGDWIRLRSIDTPADMLRLAFFNVSDANIADREDVRAELIAMGIRGEVMEPLLETSRELREFDSKLMHWRRPLQDKAVAMLTLTGRTLSTEEITDLIEPDSIRSLLNAMAADPRVDRVGRGRWALTSWGLDSYEGIVPAMIERLRNGDRVIAELADELADDFGISPNSVKIYANTHPAFIQEGQRVRLRGDHEPYVSTARLEDSPACRANPDGRWSLVVPVDRDVLRGSGRAIPEAFAVHLGLEPLSSIEIDSDLGPIRLSWNHVPAIGSLRPFALQLGAVHGDHLRITAIRPGVVEFTVFTLDGASAE